MRPIIECGEKPTKSEFIKLVKTANIMGHSIDINGSLEFYTFQAPFYEENIKKIAKEKGSEPIAAWPKGCIYVGVV